MNINFHKICHKYVTLLHLCKIHKTSQAIYVYWFRLKDFQSHKHVVKCNAFTRYRPNVDELQDSLGHLVAH